MVSVNKPHALAVSDAANLDGASLSPALSAFAMLAHLAKPLSENAIRQLKCNYIAQRYVEKNVTEPA